MWLTQRGMEKVLQGEIPSQEDIVPKSELWSEELRIGLKRCTETRAAQEGMLYSTRHVRLIRGVSIGANITGIPENWKLPFDPPTGVNQLVPFGGESRLVECKEWSTDSYLKLPLEEIKEKIKNDQNGRIAVIALSPLDLKKEIYCGKKPIEALGGALVVSACLDRPQRIGGWNSLTRKPLPLRSVLPPGGVLFCDGGKSANFEIFQKTMDSMKTNKGVLKIGARQEWGFGLVTLGIWPH